MADDVRTIAGTIYWPLYPFKLIRSEVLSNSFNDYLKPNGVSCPYLKDHKCTISSPVDCSSANCEYKSYQEYFLLYDLDVDHFNINQFNDTNYNFGNGSNYENEVFTPDAIDYDTIKNTLHFFPQPFKCLDAENHLVPMKSKRFFEESPKTPFKIRTTYKLDETIYIKSEYKLFKPKNDVPLPDKAFHRLLEVSSIQNILPRENFDHNKDRLLAVRLSFFADGNVDAVLSLLVRSEDGWDKKHRKFPATTQNLRTLVQQALGSINNDLLRERRNFLFSWCYRLKERVSGIYQGEQAPKRTGSPESDKELAKKEAEKLAHDAVQIMCNILAADEYIQKNTGSINLEIDFGKDEWVLSNNPNLEISNNRRKYIDGFLRNAYAYTYEALANNTKLKGRLSAASALEIQEISQSDDALRARVLLRGEAGGGKGVAAEDFHNSCMRRIAGDLSLKKNYLNCVAKALKRIMELPPLYLTEVSDTEKIHFFKRQVAGTGWWQWGEKASVDDMLSKLINKFERNDKKDDLIKIFKVLLRAKLKFESSKGEEADWSFNLFQINCGIMGGQGNELMESLKRLFGRGSDLLTSVPGVFQTCSYVGGTLFLDEIADAPVRIQDNLLRPLEEGSVSRLGWETHNEQVKDVRIVGATFKDLFALSKQYQQTLPTGNPKGFRPDLLTRLTRNSPVTVKPVWEYFLPKSTFDYEDYPIQFSFVLKTAFKVDRPFWTDVYYVVSRKLDEYDRMAKHHIPDDIDRRRHFASKITMRLFKQLGKLAEDKTQDKKNDLLTSYLPRMLDYLLSDS